MKLEHPIAFVFSGGSSLGALHVGMLKATQEFGIQPDFLVGSSVGALNAAWMGADYSAAQIKILEDFWESLHTRDIFQDISLRSFLTFMRGSSGSVSSLKGLEKIIFQRFPPSFSNLRIPTHVMVSDLTSGSPVDFEEGDLRLSLLASTAIPGIFPSVKMGERELADGSLTAHLPLQRALALGAKTILIFDSSYPCKLQKIPSHYIPKLLYMLTIMIQQQARCTVSLSKEKGASLIYLPVPCPISVMPHDFSQSKFLIEKTYGLTKEFLKKHENFAGGYIGGPHIHHSS